MTPVLIAIDDAVRRTWGQALTPLLRNLFSLVGFPFRIVSGSDEAAQATLAYGLDPSRSARISVRFDPALHGDPADLSGKVNVVEGVPWICRTSAPPLRRTGDRWEVDADILSWSRLILSGALEEPSQLTRRGNLRGSIGPLAALGLVDQPVLNLYANWLRDRIAESHGPPLAMWPEGKRYAVILSHDVDYPEPVRIVEACRILLRPIPNRLAAALDMLLGRSRFWHFDEWTNYESERGFRSTFFFIAKKGSLLRFALGDKDGFYDVHEKKYVELLRRLREAGLEIGLHTSFNGWRSEERIRMEKSRLEHASGGEIVGARHHCFKLDPQAPERTLRLDAESGLLYDSSLAFQDVVGFRRSIAAPFVPLTMAGPTPRFLELPPTLMDAHLFRAPHDDFESAWAAAQGHLARVKQCGGMANLIFHVRTWNDVVYPGWAEVFRRLVSDLGSDSQAWVATAREVAEHWLKRNDRLGLFAEPQDN